MKAFLKKEEKDCFLLLPEEFVNGTFLKMYLIRSLKYNFFIQYGTF